MASINLRIKELRELQNLSSKEFSSILGIDNSQYSKIEQGKLKPTLQHIMEICSTFEVNTDWLLTGKGGILKNNSEDQKKEREGRPYLADETSPLILNEPEDRLLYRLKKDYYNVTKQQQIPLYEIEASAGLNLLFANQSNQIPVDYISVPNAPKCDGALFVRGDSMYPLLKSGDIVCYKHIKDIQNNIRFGEIYLLYINDGDDEYLTLKYIQESDKGEEYIKLVSENRHHSAKNEHISHVKAVALVKLSIRYNTIS